MKWSECYSSIEMPGAEQIEAFIASPLWGELCAHLQSRYGVLPKTDYSTCSGAPGWNVKYKKSGREGGFHSGPASRDTGLRFDNIIPF